MLKYNDNTIILAKIISNDFGSGVGYAAVHLDNECRAESWDSAHFNLTPEQESHLPVIHGVGEQNVRIRLASKDFQNIAPVPPQGLQISLSVKNPKPTVDSVWKCIDESSEYYGKFCMIQYYDDNPDFNGDGTIELLYSNGDVYTGKVRRFMPRITHQFVSATPAIVCKECGKELKDHVQKLYELCPDCYKEEQ